MKKIYLIILIICLSINNSKFAISATDNDIYKKIDLQSDLATTDSLLLEMDLNKNRLESSNTLLHKNDKLLATARAWHRGLESVIKHKLNELDKAGLILEGASYQRILESGFALVTDKSGKTVSAVNVSSGEKLGVRFFDGDINVEVKSGIGTKPPSKSSLNLKKPRRNVNEDAQGKLI